MSTSTATKHTKKKRAAKRKPHVDQKLSKDERNAIHWCKTRGLFLLAYGTGKTRAWIIYDQYDGAELGSYFPNTKYISKHGHAKPTKGWLDALHQIAR